MTYGTDGHWINHVLTMHPEQFHAQATMRERPPNQDLLVPLDENSGGPEGPDEQSEDDESDDDAPGRQR